VQGVQGQGEKVVNSVVQGAAEAAKKAAENAVDAAGTVQGQGGEVVLPSRACVQCCLSVCMSVCVFSYNDTRTFFERVCITHTHTRTYTQVLTESACILSNSMRIFFQQITPVPPLCDTCACVYVCLLQSHTTQGVSPSPYPAPFRHDETGGPQYFTTVCTTRIVCITRIVITSPTTHHRHNRFSETPSARWGSCHRRRRRRLLLLPCLEHHQPYRQNRGEVVKGETRRACVIICDLVFDTKKVVSDVFVRVF
jgi:hypothetical protein